MKLDRIQKPRPMQAMELDRDKSPDPCKQWSWTGTKARPMHWLGQEQALLQLQCVEVTAAVHISRCILLGPSCCKMMMRERDDA
eukprot:1154321-Pelagomonas_calceolata.AAC.1